MPLGLVLIIAFFVLLLLICFRIVTEDIRGTRHPPAFGQSWLREELRLRPNAGRQDLPDDLIREILRYAWIEAQICAQRTLRKPVDVFSSQIEPLADAIERVLNQHPAPEDSEIASLLAPYLQQSRSAPE
jgi:hypothetical protein